MAKKFEVQQEFIGVLSIYELNKKTLFTGSSSVAVSNTSMHTTLACVLHMFPGAHYIS
jgi:hypothetical protein